MVKTSVLRLVSDYIVQEYRFAVFAGFGCMSAPDGSVLGLLLMDSWSVIFPLLSITIYYRMSTKHIGII